MRDDTNTAAHLCPRQSERINQLANEIVDECSHAMGARVISTERARWFAVRMIEAMTVPTEAALNAARDWSYAKYGKPIGNDAATGCWKAMIRADMGQS